MTKYIFLFLTVALAGGFVMVVSGRDDQGTAIVILSTFAMFMVALVGSIDE